MSLVRPRWVVLALSAIVILVSSIPGAAPIFLPRPLAPAIDASIASAQIADAGNFGSAVPCLESPDQLVTSCFANTLVRDSDSNGNDTFPVASSDTALVRFNTGGKTPLANLGQVGSVYGMAYDDGSVSGVRRLLVGAFARRMTNYGPDGAGAIYQYNVTTGATSLFAVVPGTTNRHATGDPNDDQIATWVGKSSLGDLEIGPSGTTLYALNLDTRQIERYDLRTGSRLAPLAINLSALSSDPAVQADLRPFALEFQPTLNNTQPLVYVGLVDSGERSPNNVYPTAYVIGINPVTGGQLTLLTQPLNHAAMASRFNDGANAGQAAWHAWTPTGKNALWPMPIVADLQWSRDGSMLLVGLRDRNGDVYQADQGDQWWRVQEQGDVLVYRNVGGVWQLQTRSVATPSDFFHDSYVGTSTSTAHVENFMGALALTLAGSGSAMVEQVVGTVIAPLQGGTAGANWYNLRPDSYDRQAAVEIFPGGDLWKSSTLGDLENLCTAAYIGDRIWRDANGNGIQDAGEAGIGGVLLNLLDASGALVAQATTEADGSYLFAVIPGRDYAIEVAASNFSTGQVLFNYVIAPQNRGGDDALDSDADQISHRIAVPPQYRDASITTFDIGVISAVLANGEAGDLVWNDLNANGIQDGGEPGVANVSVRLVDLASGSIFMVTTTDPLGLYRFRNITPGNYQIEFVPPPGVSATARDNGGNDALDSDADAGTGWRTPPFAIIADTIDRTLDLGLRMGANVWAQKTGPATAVTGSQFDYTLTFGNNGASTADAVGLADTLPAGLTFVSATPAPSSVVGQALSWSLGSLPPTGAAPAGIITVRVQVDTNAPATLSNRASISTSTPSDDPGDNTSTITTQIIRPNVFVQKTGPATVTAGDQLIYTLAYGNAGDAPAASVALVDTLPADLTFVSASPAPTGVAGQSLTWALGTLAPGQRGSISVVAQASALAASGSVALNQAGISTATPGDDPGDNTSSTATIVQRADVRVTKSSPTGFPVASGQPVAYDIDYANAGPATARNVTLNDTVPAQIANVVWQCSSGCAGSGTGNTLALSLGDLAAGASGRVRVSGVAQTSTAREDFTNTAIIATTTPETDLANNQSSVPGAVWTSDLQLIKLAQAQVAAGDTFTATLAYKNNGPAPAAGTILSDTLPSGITFVSASPAPAAVSGSLLSWNLGTLADGQSGSIGLVLRSDPAAPDATVVVNRAQISTATSDRDPANNTSTAATLLLARADVMVLKTAPARADAGDLIQYSLSYRNNGPSVARSALLTDTLPAELTFVSAGPAPRSSAGSVLAWALGDLAPGQAGSITVQARSRFAQELPRLSLINTAQISSSTNDPAPANNTSSATTAIETADLSVIKRAPQYIIAGAPFTVTLDYANAGPASARNATLRDLLPGGLTFVSASPAPTGPGLRWSLGDLAGGARGSISVVLRAPTSAISGTTYTNVAVIDTPASPDRDPGNDVSSTISAVQPNADLSILKRGPAAPVRSGSQVAYQLTYHNAGPSQALQARVVDVLPAGFSFTSASPAPTQVTSTTLTWALGTLDAGTGGSITVVGQLAGAGATTLRTNIATIDSPATPDPAPGNNTSTVDTTVLRPDLSVFKTDHLTTAQPGDTLTYDLSVRNTGATTATGVLLRETPPPGAVVLSSAWAGQSDGSYTLALGDLAAGAVATRQFALRLPNPLPAPAGPIANTVVVSDDGSAGADPTPADNTSTDIDTPLAGRLGDFVWYDKDGDGQQEAGEAGLGDVTMRLIDANGALLATTTTDLSGHYLFEGVRMGSYAVALAPATTQVGLLRGYRYTTPPTPIGTISVASPADLALDIGLHNPGSTDIVLAYLRAERGEDGTVALSWRTLEEINTAHFRVLRAPTERLSTASPIAQLPSQGSGGGVYRLLDPQPPAHAFYWLVEVERSGREQIYGPLDPQPVATTATLLTFVPIVRR